MGRRKGVRKDKHRGLFGKDLVNSVSDENGNITRDVGYVLLMGNESVNKVVKDVNKVYMVEYSIQK